MQTLKVLKILEQSGEELLAKAMKQPENECRHDLANLVASIKAARRIYEREILENHHRAAGDVRTAHVISTKSPEIEISRSSDV
tara:strand:+ start:55962 stop:56213 length:252 start_codon:yes stop_codon:yes gene_type:complete